jgi:hypothetical protein
MKLQLNFSAETADYLLCNPNSLFKVQFVGATTTGEIILEFDAIKPEWLAMGLFLAGQSYTMKQVKNLFDENRVPA